MHRGNNSESHGLMTPHGRSGMRIGIILVIVAASSMLVTSMLDVKSVPAIAIRPACLMSPPLIQIPLPQVGFKWLKDEEQTGACEVVPAEKWLRKASGSADLFAHADGPSGSGHYWTITVGVAEAGIKNPKRGVCFATSTVGWRTLQQYKVSPLPWLDDVDGDGKSEVILWDSFPLRDGASMAEYGLTAWVYRHSEKDSLTLDWKLSRGMARDIAAAYRKPLKTESESLAPVRTIAATVLDQFADEACHAPAEAPQ